MDEDAAWYGSRPRPRPHCTRRGLSSRERGTAQPPLFGPCLLWPRSPISATAELLSITLFENAYLPAALRAAQIWRYLVYSEADFEVFRPAGATRCTDGGDKGVGPTKLKFLLRFDQNVEYKRPAGAYHLRDFHKICRVCTFFQDVLGVKIWLDLLKGLWSYGGFKLRGSGFPQIFSAP